MRRGLWSCARQVVDREASKDPGALKSAFDVESRVIQNELKELKKLVESTMPQSSITPGERVFLLLSLSNCSQFVIIRDNHLPRFPHVLFFVLVSLSDQLTN